MGLLPVEKTMPSKKIGDYVNLIYGPPGVGKSTLANKFGGGNVLFFSTDRGTRFFPGGSFNVPVHRWSDALAVLAELEKSKKARARYSGFAIDHVDDLAFMCEHYVCKKLGIEHPGDAEWGKGWSKLRSEFQTFTQRLLRFGKGINFIAHEDHKEVQDGVVKVMRCGPAMSKSSWKVIVPLADIVMYCGWERVKKKDPQTGKVRRVKQRIAVFEPRQDLYAKDRTGLLPASMPLDGTMIRDVFANQGK